MYSGHVLDENVQISTFVTDYSIHFLPVNVA